MLLQTWGAEAQGCTQHPLACRLLAATGTGGLQSACRGFWDTISESCMEVLDAHRKRVRWGVGWAVASCGAASNRRCTLQLAIQLSPTPHWPSISAGLSIGSVCEHHAGRTMLHTTVFMRMNVRADFGALGCMALMASPLWQAWPQVG